MTRGNTVETKVRQSFVDKLQMTREEAKKINIERAHRVGNSVGENKSIVVVKFNCFKRRDELFQRCMNKPLEYYANEDFSLRVM